MNKFFLDNQQGPFDTRDLLKNAAAQKDRYKDFLVVDADAHHYESESWAQITKYIDEPLVRQWSEAVLAKGGGQGSMMPTQVGNQDISGRLTRYLHRKSEKVDESVPRDVTVIRRSMEQMGIDYTIMFPTPMLNLGLHPNVEVEVAFARAYARWITENVLSVEPRIKTMLYLPLSNPDASLKLIEEFAEKPSVVGFMITTVRYRPIHDNAYMKVYAALEERGLPLGFHAAYNTLGHDRSMEQLNRFISVHALGFPFYHMVHLTNFVINGIPERFPKLKVIWIEGGLAWLTFLMQRLDNEYMMRSSEAPLLTRRPSEYMADFYYTSQPLERTATNENLLKDTLDLIHAETQLLYASDFPHWDFDLPSQIYDLPFLSETAKRRILGENARGLFHLEPR